MRRTGVLAAAASAAAFMLMAPLAASAAPAVHAGPALATCVGIVVNANSNADLYSGWNSFRITDTVVAAPTPLFCEGFSLGRRYTACGESDGNGWVKIRAGVMGVGGWGPSACFDDV